MALGTVRVEGRRVECPADIAPQRRQEIAPASAEQGGGGGQPLPLHPLEPFKSRCRSIGSRRLQRLDQRDGMEPLSMIAIDPDKSFERPLRLAGVTRCQRVQQCVDRRGLRAVDEEIELAVLPGTTKSAAQEGIQRRIGGCRQNRSGVLLPAVMHHRLAVQTERLRPRPRPFEPCPHLVRTAGQDCVQARETSLAPRPVVLVAEPVRGQQQLQRRVLPMLHHELLNGGLHFPGVGVHATAEIRSGCFD